MYLKSLEITGFKSFAKKASLHFNSPISAIVGPNGSGKSNAAEAFRFVLGEQSIKSMRGKRGEDLIFNGGAGPASSGGSAAGGRANRAGVKVIFDNAPESSGPNAGKRALNIDYDEVTIERVVHRDSSNEYLINGSPVRLKDISELLSGAHIGASGHHIISQGEADRILSANIRERREMVEDALGLKIYQYKKDESVRKLEKTEENMKSVESLRREIAPHLKFLKKQVEKVEKVQEMRDTLRGLYREYLKREEIYLKAERKAVDHEKQSPTHELAKLDHELAAAKAHLAESKNRDAKSDEVIALEGKLAGVRTHKDSVGRDLGKIEGEINAGIRAIQKERDKQARDEFKTIYLKDVEAIVHKINQFESMSDARALFAEIKNLFTGFINLHKHGGQGGAGMDIIGDIEKDIARLKQQKTELEAALSKASDDERTLTAEYHALREKIEREKDVDRDAEKNVFKIIARQNEIRGILNALRTREDKLVIEEEAWKRELQEAYAIVGREAVDYAGLEFAYELTAEGRSDRSPQDERRRQIEKIKIRIEDSGAGNSADIMKEFKEVEERDGFLARELEDLEKSRVSLIALIADLDARLDHEFREGILKINAQFQNFFSLMFGGGTAELVVVREKRRKKKSDTDLAAALDNDADAMEDAAAGADGEGEEEGREGIDISVNLPRKKVKALMMLSGGERALTSIALLFAISQVNPPPFIILDETDAALDEANSRKYGDMIENLSKLSQLILITHNRETMSRAGILYGVTMGADGASKLLSIQFDEAVRVAK
ncbi:MAG: Smc, chromosome segregation ATPase, chromosome segregation protein [Candidatus Taylorbacteria bacterium]|nr:Smc, chromosome segregation ATPase, chromosome segregation protein [Candidatus Taylorbacteria bacterium]